jgi:group I intron endonuclease
MKTGVYTITNITNGHIYVGCTKQTFNIRWNLHKKQLKLGVHNNKYLQRAWNICGEENFIFEILVECDENIMYSEEHYWATILNTHNRNFGFNLKPTHPNNKSLISSETRDKLREKANGRKWSNEYKELFKQNKIGILHSEEHRNKAAKGKYKSILQYSLDNVFIKEWESSKTASITLNLNSSNITCALKGIQKSCGGFIWKYKVIDYAK